MEEVWRIEVRDGEPLTVKAHPVAHRSLEGAQLWCDESCALEGGPPLRWHPLCKSGAVVEGTCLMPGNVRRWYVVYRMAVAD